MLTQYRFLDSAQLSVPTEDCDDKSAPTVSGYAIIFGAQSRSFDTKGVTYTEVINKESITFDPLKVCAFWNHNSDLLLASTKSDLRVEIDDFGVKFSFPADRLKDVPTALDAIADGDCGVSFGFRYNPKDVYQFSEKGQNYVSYKKIEIFEVSPVSRPAYPATEDFLSLRSEIQDVVVEETVEETVVEEQSQILSDIEAEKAITESAIQDIEIDILSTIINKIK